jgi:hypothetical protein
VPDSAQHNICNFLSGSSLRSLLFSCVNWPSQCTDVNLWKHFGTMNPSSDKNWIWYGLSFKVAGVVHLEWVCKSQHANLTFAWFLQAVHSGDIVLLKISIVEAWFYCLKWTLGVMSLKNTLTVMEEVRDKLSCGKLMLQWVLPFVR